MRAGVCKNKAKCFAKTDTSYSEYGYCSILKEAINNYPCPFCKEDKEYTNGIHYPFNPIYKMAGANGKEDEEEE